MRYRARIIAATALCAVSPAAVAELATFDDLVEGQTFTTLTNGGITLHDYDARFPGMPPPNIFCIEDASGDLNGIPGFSSPNTLGFFGYSPGSGTAFSRIGEIWFDTIAPGSQVSLELFVTSDSANIVTLEAYSNGLIVGTDVVSLAFTPFFQHFTLSVENVSFDTVRLVGSGPNEQGTFFAVVDNVSITTVPEPATFVAIGAGLTLLSLRRRR